MTLRKEYLVELQIAKSRSVRPNVDKIEEKIKDHILDDSEVHRSSQILEIVIGKYLVVLVRRLFKDNNLASDSEKDFEAKDGYLESRVNVIINEFTKKMDTLWWVGTKPSRASVYESQKTLEPEITELIKEMFRKGREIAFKFKNNKKYAKEHLEDTI